MRNTGATIFWQVDKQMKIRTGKIILYEPNTGKRVKDSWPNVTWVHSTIRQDFGLSQCLYGEHLHTR